MAWAAFRELLHYDLFINGMGSGMNEGEGEKVKQGGLIISVELQRRRLDMT